ncbi:alpha/beta hydrolase [Aeromicrobium sp.]|uniref:alpha/beta hydrolase n=1 Tax=Aeromicrobium sp. TaxID=1871063 RepID=UPI003C566E48
MNPAEPRSFSRTETSFDSHGVSCAATVYRAEPRPAGAVPVVVMAHGFGSVRALRLYAYAERFAAAGYTVVVFDYRGFGDSDGEPRQLLDISMQHQDWRSALTFARTLDDVDANQVVAWGTSFAGGHVLTLAGQGEPLAAVIAQVPHVSGLAAVRATGLKASARLLPAAVRDQIRAVRRRGPVYVDLVGQPGGTAIMTSPDAAAALQRLTEDSGIERGVYREDVAARIALKIGLYSPGRRASRITCPALVQIAQHDSITPRTVAEKAAAQIPQSTVRVYDCGHFDPYVEPNFTQVVADQLAFLKVHVPLSPAT